MLLKAAEFKFARNVESDETGCACCGGEFEGAKGFAEDMDGR